MTEKNNCNDYQNSLRTYVFGRFASDKSDIIGSETTQRHLWNTPFGALGQKPRICSFLRVRRPVFHRKDS